MKLFDRILPQPLSSLKYHHIDLHLSRVGIMPYKAGKRERYSAHTKAFFSLSHDLSVKRILPGSTTEIYENFYNRLSAPGVLYQKWYLYSDAVVPAVPEPPTVRAIDWASGVLSILPCWTSSKPLRGADADVRSLLNTASTACDLVDWSTEQTSDNEDYDARPVDASNGNSAQIIARDIPRGVILCVDPGSVPQQSTLKSRKMMCGMDGCTSRKQFDNPQNIKRHMKKHQDPTLDCPAPGCDRKGENGFARRDKLNDHFDKIHKK